MPSAIPKCTIIVPKYEMSAITSRARSMVMPLCARSAVYSCAKRSVYSDCGGREDLRATDVDAEFRCASTHTGFVTEDRQVGNLGAAAAGRPRAGSGRRHPQAGRCACDRVERGR